MNTNSTLTDFDYPLTWAEMAPELVPTDLPNGTEPAGGPLPNQESNAMAAVREPTTSGGTQTVIEGVEEYIWHHGCGPTAAGIVLGYWDSQGFPDLVVGDSSTQTSEVDAMMASTEHYNDYSLPIDNSTTGILADLSSLGGAHSDNSVADWMHTSWSADGNYYGWSYFSRVDDAISGYSNHVGYSDWNTWNETWGHFTWDDYVTEIDNGRPMVFLVDTDGNGGTDHFVTAVGYDDTLQQYACHDTWGSTSDIVWFDFAQMASGQPWGIYGATFIDPGSLADDVYEENDTQSTAYDLSGYEQTWLSSIDGEGIANDDDYYEIEVLPGETHLDVDLEFAHENGDIDIQVYDDSGNSVAGGYSTTDNEYIDVDLDPGTYYLNVYPYSGSSNTYNLRWESVAEEDAYEQYDSNDTQENAYWLSGYEQTWLSSIDGEGIANDDDYYAIEVSPGEERLLVDLQFGHTDGDIDIAVYDADGNSVDSSTSITDNEFIDVEVSSPGTYYLDVYTWSGSTPGNTYDLLWLDHDPYGTSGADTIDGTAYQDTLYGYGGNDVLSGDQDRDKLYGGGGADSLYGDQGNDKLFGQNGADKLYGGGGRDILRGGNGIDRLYGQGGHDKLFGDNGNDKLFGGNGNDTLTGAAVNAASPGESDIDRLKGNAGADLFVLGDVSQVYYEGSGSARILDFNISQNDVIQLYDSPALYQLSESLGNTRIELNNGELIGIVKGVTGLDLDESYFSFV